jgi:small subunit ribosomal protein S3
MAVGETSGQGQPRRVVSSGTRRRAEEVEAPLEESATLIKEADPELEKLLDEEEEIARRTRQSHEAPHFRADED